MPQVPKQIAPAAQQKLHTPQTHPHVLYAVQHRYMHPLRTVRRV